MVDEVKIKSESKMNKKILFIATAVVLIVLAVAVISVLSKSAKADKMEKQLELGDKYLSELDYEQARVTYQSLIEIDPKCEDAYLGLADTYIAQGEYDMAETALKEALDALDGENGKVQRRLNEIEQLRRGAEITPTPMPTNTPVPTPTYTPVPTPTLTNTPVPTPTVTNTPTPTPTATNTPTPTPRFTFKELDKEMYAKDSVNVRDLPSSEGKKLGSLSAWEKVTVTGQCNETDWYRIIYKGENAYVSGNYLVDNKPTPTLTPTNTPTPTPVLEGEIRVELELASDCFTYDTDYNKYVCTGLSEKGYEEFKKYGPAYLVSIKLPAVSDKGRTVYGFHSDSNGGYDLTEMLTETSAYVELVCPDEYVVYYGVRDNSPKSKYVHKLKNVVLNDGLEIISSSAFYNCDGIEKVEIPETVKQIENSAFYKCIGLTEVVIPNSVEVLGSSAFYGCTGLTEVVISDSVTELGSRAFYGCTNISKIELPESVKIYGFGVFYECKNLVIDNFEMGGKTLGSYVFKDVRINTLTMSTEVTKASGDGGAFKYADVGKLEIKDGVKQITSHVFYGCEWLKQIDIPETVEVIGNYAFRDCIGLEKISVPESVEEIGNGAFYGCTNLESVELPENVKTYGWGAFYECKNLIIDNFEVGGKTFGSYVFKNVRINTLTMSTDVAKASSDGGTFKYADVGKVEIKDGVKQIASYLFYECDWLEEITIPMTIETIGNSAFRDCVSITEIKLPESLKKIGWNAFMDCTGLTSIVIPESVTEIDTQAFWGCDNLTIEKFDVTGKTLGSNIFRGATVKNLYVSGTVKADSSGCLEGAILEKVEIAEGVEEISDYLFMDCTSLKEVKLPESLKKIGWNAFMKCTGLTSIVIPESVTEIETQAFWGCDNLKIEKFEVAGKTLGSNIFRGATVKNLYVSGTVNASYSGGSFEEAIVEKVEIAEGVEEISDYLFMDCTSLREVKLPESLKKIGWNAFMNCTGLTSIAIPESVTEIETQAFWGCKNLTIDSFEVAGKTLGSNIFRDATVKTLYVSGTVSASYSGGSFEEAILEKVEIAEGVEEISDYLFMDCTSLREVKLPESLKKIGWNAFMNCTGLTSIAIPESVTEIETQAFYNCNNLTIHTPAGSYGDSYAKENGIAVQN